MSLPQARRLFARLMEKSQKEKLTNQERKLLIQARQVLRAEKKGKRNPKWFPVTKRKAKRLGEAYRKAYQRFVARKNPRRGTLIYGRVLKIYAQKTSGPYKGQRFVHTFKPGAIMVGMPDGSLKILHR